MSGHSKWHNIQKRTSARKSDRGISAGKTPIFGKFPSSRASNSSSPSRWDVTEEVAEEAGKSGADLIVAHHPVMNCAWSPVQSLREDDLQGRLLRRLVRENISVICMHTNLAPGRPRPPWGNGPRQLS